LLSKQIQTRLHPVGHYAYLFYVDIIQLMYIEITSLGLILPPPVAIKKYFRVHT